MSYVLFLEGEGPSARRELLKNRVQINTLGSCQEGIFERLRTSCNRVSSILPYWLSDHMTRRSTLPRNDLIGCESHRLWRCSLSPAGEVSTL